MTTISYLRSCLVALVGYVYYRSMKSSLRNTTDWAAAKYATSTNVLWISNWRTLVHMLQADTACALIVWQAEMTSMRPPWTYDLISKNRTSSIDAYYRYLKNNAAEFHPDPIWNDGALGFSKMVAPTRTTWRRTTRWLLATSNMGSIPDPKINDLVAFFLFCTERIGSYRRIHKKMR